jgi:hypothetical protein
VEDTIVGVGYAQAEISFIAIAPDTVFGCLVLKYLHLAFEHYRPEKSTIEEVDTGLGVLLVLLDPHGVGISGEKELFDAVMFSWLEHHFHIGISLVIHRPYERSGTFFYKGGSGLYILSHHICLRLGQGYLWFTPSREKGIIYIIGEFTVLYFF